MIEDKRDVPAEGVMLPPEVVRDYHESLMAPKGGDTNASEFERIVARAVDINQKGQAPGQQHNEGELREQIVLALSRLKFVDRGTYSTRLECCRGCEHVRQVEMPSWIAGGMILSCRKCNCIMNAKARLSRTKCPVGRF